MTNKGCAVSEKNVEKEFDSPNKIVNLSSQPTKRTEKKIVLIFL